MGRFLMIFLLFCLPAQAADPVKMTLKYDAYWGGIPAADVTIGLTPNGDKFHSHIDLQTNGILKATTKFKAYLYGDGIFTDAGLRTQKFHSVIKSRSRKTDRSWHVDDDKNVISTDTHVPEELRRDTLDPVSALFDLHRQIQKSENLKTGKFSTPIFDGRRRYDVLAKYVQHRERLIGQTNYKVVEFELSATPISGIKEKDIEQWRTARVTVYFSDDDYFIPLQIMAEAAYIPAVFNIAKDCEIMTACAGSLSEDNSVN